MPELRTVYFARIDSLEVGPLLLAATAKGLCCLHFFKGTMPSPGKDETWIESPEYLQPYISQLESYFRGELREFTFPLDLAGTQFQKDCWQALLQIPYGKTCSYADIARAIGRPTAFRAWARRIMTIQSPLLSRVTGFWERIRHLRVTVEALILRKDCFA